VLAQSVFTLLVNKTVNNFLSSLIIVLFNFCHLSIGDTNCKPSNMKIEVLGSNGDTDTFFCVDIARRIGKPKAAAEPSTSTEEGKEEVSASEAKEEEAAPTTPEFDVEVVFNAYLEIDYIKKIKALQKESGGAYYHHTATHLVILDGKYLGDINKLGAWAVENKYIDEIGEGNQVVHNRLSREEFTHCITERGGKRVVFLEFADGSPHVDETTPDYGKVVIELFDDVVPLAAENFFKLCTGELGATEVAKLHYINCPVHRVVAGGWMQCGDIVAGDGSGSYAAVGEDGKVHDESFVFDFGGPLPGMVGYVRGICMNRGFVVCLDVQMFRAMAISM